MQGKAREPQQQWGSRALEHRPPGAPEELLDRAKTGRYNSAFITGQRKKGKTKERVQNLP